MNRREAVFALGALGSAPLVSTAARSDNNRGDGPKIAATVVSQSGGIGATNQRTGVFYAGNDGPLAAIAAAVSGDTILITPGTYTTRSTWSITTSITLKSSVSGTKFSLDGSWLPNLGSVPIISADANSLTVLIEDGEFYGNKGQYGYCPGVATRASGCNMTLRRCLIRDNSNGILGGNVDTSGTWLIEDCEIRDNGWWTAFRMEST